MRLSRPQTSLTRHRQPPESTGRPVPAMSYYSRRSDEALNTGRNLLRRETTKRTARAFARFWFHRFGLATLLITALICLADIVSLSSNPRIVLEGGSSQFVRQSAAYQTATNKLLAASIWDRNKLTLNPGQLSNQLKDQFPELTDVSITLPLLAHRPVIYLQASPPAVILNSASGSYVLGTNGKALVAADTLTATTWHLPVVTDQSGLALALNRQALTSDDINFIQTIVAQLAAHHFSVSAMTLPASTSELDVQVAGQPYLVKFNLENRDARQQAGTYLATQAYLQSQNITPAQYIDARVDGRAYYK
jgi:hypothetical protein